MPLCKLLTCSLMPKKKKINKQLPYKKLTDALLKSTSVFCCLIGVYNAGMVCAAVKSGAFPCRKVLFFACQAFIIGKAFFSVMLSLFKQRFGLIWELF